MKSINLHAKFFATATAEQNKKNTIFNFGKKLLLALIFVLSSNMIFAQGAFDKFDGQDDVTSIIVNKKILIFVFISLSCCFICPIPFSLTIQTINRQFPHYLNPKTGNVYCLLFLFQADGSGLHLHHIY